MRKLLQNGAVGVAFLIFSGLLVKEWFDVKAADALEAKTGQPQRKPDTGFASTLADFFDFKPMHAQQRFFRRWSTQGMYAPESKELMDKLDLDDPVITVQYQREPDSFTKRLRELKIDINTVWVKPDPVNIRVLGFQEGNPATKWTLYLLTGADTAQQLEDGVHLRRRGYPDKLVGWPIKDDDLSGYSEASHLLWHPNGRGGWYVEEDGSGFIRQVSFSTIHEIRKHQDFGPQYQLDCDALRRFAQPLRTGESTREITLNVDVPVSPKFDRKSGRLPCEVWLQ